MHTPAIKLKQLEQRSGKFLTNTFFPPSFFGPSCPSESWKKRDCAAVCHRVVFPRLSISAALLPPSGRQKNVSLVFFCGEGLTIQASAALSQLRKRHEINVMSMVFCGETPRRSVKVTLPSPLVPRRYGGSEMRWRMTVWQRCLRLHRLFHLCVYHLQVADPKRSLDIRRRPRRPSCNVAAAASLRFSQRGRGSSLGGPPPHPSL